MRKRIVAAGACLAAVVVVAPVVALAASGQEDGVVDAQSMTWRDDSVSTSNENFTEISGISPVALCTDTQPISVTVSMHLRDAPVDVRVLDDTGGTVLRPGHVRFVQGTPSFTFIGEGTDSVGTELTVQWRSPTDKRATARKATVVAQYSDNC